jgi:hypothetical protein
MIVKFITMKGASNIAATPFYVGFVQHDRTMSRRETYEYCAERTGFKAAAIRAVFLALAEFIRENQRRGNITYLDGVASIRNYVKGAFKGLAGPWVKGVNHLSVQAVEMDPFKSLLAAIIPTNNSEGAKPAINTVLDETKAAQGQTKGGGRGKGAWTPGDGHGHFQKRLKRRTPGDARPMLKALCHRTPEPHQPGRSHRRDKENEAKKGPHFLYKSPPNGIFSTNWDFKLGFAHCYRRSAAAAISRPIAAMRFSMRVFIWLMLLRASLKCAEASSRERPSIT